MHVRAVWADMADPAIDAYLEETRALARELGIGGTPAFVVGDTLVPGVIDTAQMKDLVAAARAGDNPG